MSIYFVETCDLCHKKADPVFGCKPGVSKFRFWTKGIRLCDNCHKTLVKMTLLKMEEILSEYKEAMENNSKEAENGTNNNNDGL